MGAEREREQEREREREGERKRERERERERERGRGRGRDKSRGRRQNQRPANGSHLNAPDSIAPVRALRTWAGAGRKTETRPKTGLAPPQDHSRVRAHVLGRGWRHTVRGTQQARYRSCAPRATAGLTASANTPATHPTRMRTPLSTTLREAWQTTRVAAKPRRTCWGGQGDAPCRPSWWAQKSAPRTRFARGRCAASHHAMR